MEKNSTYGLKLDQMAGLFSMGAEEPDPTDERSVNETMATLLHEQLACALPRHSLLFDALLMMMDQEGHDTRSLAGRSLGRVLLEPQSDVDLLRAIKDCSKKLSHELDSEAETALATTVYFAALASALVHHDKKITQNSYEKLGESFTLLTAKKWMAQELIGLFGRARRICESRRGEQ
jgi:hypothetical protein